VRGGDRFAADWPILFDGIPLDGDDLDDHQPPGAILLAMYIAVAEKQGVGKGKSGNHPETTC